MWLDGWIHKNGTNKMALIIKKLEFTVSEGDELTEKTLEYSKKTGFKHIVSNPREKIIRFERGSIASNMWTLNPLKWKSQIEIEIDGQEVRATFSINATGQIPTNKEEELWEAFIANHQKYVYDSNFDFLNENSGNLKSTKSKNLQYLGWTALGGIIGAIPGVFIAKSTGIDSIVSIGAAIGAVVFLMIKIKGDKKKKDL